MKTEELFTAIRNNDVTQVRAWLENGGDVDARDARDTRGDTALIRAVHEEKVEIVRMLLEYEADVNAQDEYGYTALHWVIFHEQLEIARMLLDNGANVRTKSHFGETVLVSRDVELIKEDTRILLTRMLLEYGADPYAIDDSGETVFMTVVADGHMETARMLIVEYEVDVNAQDKNGLTALHHLSSCGYENIANIVKMLIENGAKVNMPTLKGRTALIEASMYGRLGALKALIENGAHANIRDNDGRNALMGVCLSDWDSEDDKIREIIEILLKNGVSIDGKDYAGETALMIFSEAGEIEAVKTLLEFGANVHIKNKEGKTALDLATDEQVKSLLVAAERSSTKRDGSVMDAREGTRESGVKKMRSWQESAREQKAASSQQGRGGFGS